MLPLQFKAIYNQLLDDARENQNHRIFSLSEIDIADPIECILYLPLYSLGMAAHVIEPRIDYLKTRAEGHDLNFFASSPLETLEAICSEQYQSGVVFGNFFCRLYDIRQRAKMILEVGANNVENTLACPANVPDPEMFGEKLNFLMDFPGVGDKAAQHILMDLGWPFVKPDRHIQRILYRLGGWNYFFDSDEGQKTLKPNDLYKFQQRWIETVATIINYDYGLPIPNDLQNVPSLNELNSRKIDLCLMWFSQAKRRGDITLNDPVCTVEPMCDICYVGINCKYGQSRLVV